MPKTLLVVSILALTLSGKAVAGRPEGVSGKMVFDEVAEGLREYRKEKNWAKRCRLLERLAETGDPRVGLLLGEEHLHENDPWSVATRLLGEHFVGCSPFITTGERMSKINFWWNTHEADLRRSAKQLPQ